MVVEVCERLRLFHHADDLFELVSDVRRYPQFIPQITAMRVLDERRGDSHIDMTAEARVRYKFVTERFTSKVKADSAARRIDVGFVAGPFRVLENHWRFHTLSDGSCLVDFSIIAAFKNAILQMLLESNRDRAGRVLIGKFSAEAARRYGSVGDPALDLTEEINAIG
ncbi:type II toxin-antitoxin system RatA family toxin [Maricaulis sp.]|uniref:type II toxin-antitoxin system RatA family toxin n=1 Tax=Maricaulis sp. TaxID=1486257 RepID=UPI002B265FD6|nr:type II toxin-antitoxin system RatA family toxin [Maricaulis sp.]